MKTISCFFFIAVVFYFWTSCAPSPNAARYDAFDLETCNRGAEDESMSIDDLPPASSSNASSYQLSGACNNDQSEVRIFIESFPLDEYPLCQRGKWQTTVDLTGIIAQKEEFQVAISSSRGKICKEVKNQFYCPQGYIGVAKMHGFTDKDFCVMKYEAKSSESRQSSFASAQNRLAESRAEGHVITRVTEIEARRYCTDNGPGYDLINNHQWQTIARRIETVDSNWSRNLAVIEAGNRLNIGNTAGIKQNSNDREEEDNINWSYDKRWHQLSNGAYIWDFSGNLWEIVKWNSSLPNTTYRGYVHNMPQSLKQFFGPQRNYNVLDTSQRVWKIGLGHISASSFKGALLRGGSDRQTAGIFSADTTKTKTGVARLNIGFRCIYTP